MGKVQVFFCVSSLGSVGDIKLIAWWFFVCDLAARSFTKCSASIRSSGRPIASHLLFCLFCINLLISEVNRFMNREAEAGRVAF